MEFPQYVLAAAFMLMRPDNCSGRVAIVYPWRWPLPNMVDIARLLVDAGYLVEVYCHPSACFSVPAAYADRVTLFTSEAALMHGAFVVPPRWTLGRGHRPYRHLRAGLRSHGFRRMLAARHRQRHYVCVIGVDALGVPAAREMASWLDVPLGYWSLEIVSSEPAAAAADRRAKDAELSAVGDASFVLTQDTWRGQVLQEESGVDPSLLVFLPNSKAGPAKQVGSHFLHDRLGIPHSQRIILNAGFLSKWSLSREVAKTAVSWGDSVVLVLNNRDQALLDETELVGLEPPGSEGRVLLVNDAVPQSDYRSMVDSAAIGLALYSAEDVPAAYRRNITVIGFSSGKAADYLQSGVPIIVSDSPGLRDIVLKYSCGEVVQRPADVGSAVRRILSDHAAYSRNACRCFESELRLEPAVETLVRRLRSL